MSASERRKKLLEALCLRRYDTFDNLAREFNVSKRTIRYDVAELMRSYPEIETVRGYGGGIKVSDGFYLYRSSKKLTPEQCRVLKKLSAQLEGKDRDTLVSILDKFAH